MSNKGKSLVTGASGFVGRAAVAALRNAGWDVTETSRSKPAGGCGDIVHLDLDDPATILSLPESLQFDAIVHLGARVGWSGETESELLLPNVISTGLLARLAEDRGAYFLFASAAIVHGARSEKIDADSEIILDTVYGKSKWLAEQLASATNARLCILRPGGIFGADGPAHLGLNRSIADARRGRTPLLKGSGNNMRNYVFVKDVAEAILYALDEQLSGIHLLAGRESLPIKEMLQVLCDEFMPGTHPLEENGADALDQVIEPSAALPATRSFREAIIDIREASR